MKALVVGYGSIGRRHATILEMLGVEVAVCTRRELEVVNKFGSIADAIQTFKPGYVVIATETNMHASNLCDLKKEGFKGKVLVEKPLFRVCSEKDVLKDFSCEGIYAGYNLRFHSVVAYVKKLIERKGIISANFYVGSYLPFWRKEADYRKSYSTSKDGGGGVLRDLSHELDLALWFFGSWKKVSALGSNSGSLDLDVEDNCSILMSTDLCPAVTICMSYLDKNEKRELMLQSKDKTIRADLINNTLTVNKEVIRFSEGTKSSYVALHNDILGGNQASACTVMDALKVVELIEAIEISVQESEWVTNC